MKTKGIIYYLKTKKIDYLIVFLKQVSEIIIESSNCFKLECKDRQKILIISMAFLLICDFIIQIACIFFYKRLY